MTDFEFGDVVLVPFPFTDQSSIKKRPAVVVSSAIYNRNRPDIIILAVTSQIDVPSQIGTFLVPAAECELVSVRIILHGPGKSRLVEISGALEGVRVADAVRFVSAPGIQYVHTDHLGSPQKMTDANQTIVWDAVFTSFGQVYSITGTRLFSTIFRSFFAEIGVMRGIRSKPRLA